MSEQKNDLYSLLQQYISKNAKEQESILNTINNIEFKMSQISALLNRPGSDLMETKSDNKELYHKVFKEYIYTGKVNFETKAYSSGSGLYGDCIPGDSGCKDGSALVAEILNKEIVTIVQEKNIFRELARVRKVQGNRNEYLQVLDKIGDLGWIGETEPRTDNNKTPQIGRIKIELCEMYAQPKISKNLLSNDSAVDVASWLRDEIADAFLETEIKGILTGDGLAAPLGIVGRTGGIKRIETKDSEKIEFDDLLKLYNSLDPVYRAGACFVMHPRIQNMIFTMQDKNGNFISQYAFADKVPDRLFGLPVYTCSYLGDGTLNEDVPLIFGNFKLGYMIIDCDVNTFLRDDVTEKQWVKFYTTKRMGGSIMDKNAIRLLQMKQLP
jgi:HK97 family phage major capsid protein